MTISPAERKIRASFPFIRFLQAYLPLRVSRWLLKRSVARLRLQPGVQRQTLLADGVPCEWLISQTASPDQVLLYLHGGGFVLGVTHLHLKMVAYMAEKMAVRALMVDYRLGPEYPYPAALDDCVAAYRWLLKQGIQAHNIVLAGDSAGGNLAITSQMKLRDGGLPLPAAAACLSPVTDFTNKDNPQDGFKDPILPARAINFYNRAYVGQSDPRNPLISPVYGDLHGLPPLLVHVGEDEILREDALRLTNLAKSVGVDVRLEIYPRMWHVWQLYLNMPQSVQSLDDIGSFLKAHVGMAAPQPNPF
jgi:monoterpene epsilon-lactone hydrolase